MNFLYNILIFKASLLLPFFALFSKKLRLFVDGRKKTFARFAQFSEDDKIIWFHAASLGEFEQARPIIEQLKKEAKNYKILVTFFSPSGYEIRKNYELADVVCYLPLDSKKNAKKFIETVNPTLVLFVKYEFWPNFLNELKKKEIPTLLISGIFRKNQIFFQFYGQFFKKSLNAFHHFFVQDQHSKKLLKKINFTNTTISGDTRFDRVYEILQQDNQLDFVTEFKDNQYTIVAGSTWKEDEQLLVNYINNNALENEKFIIAPHNIKDEAILELQQSIRKKTILFSKKQGEKMSEYQVLIIDAIGLLTKIYSQANAAYVGGGLKTGLHNILEPATFGIPIVIGDHFEKFKEARDLVALKGCVSIKNQWEFTRSFHQLKNDEDYRNKTGMINKKYIRENIGATKIVMAYVLEKLN